MVAPMITLSLTTDCNEGKVEYQLLHLFKAERHAHP